MIRLSRLLWTLCLFRLLWPSACLSDEGNEWFERFGGLSALYHSSANVSTPAGLIPGASANVGDSTTVILEWGYDPTPSTYIMLMGGYPPDPKISARGSIASIGELGAVTYGPAVLTAGYRVPVSWKAQPYFGAGLSYAVILGAHDAALSHLEVHNNLGYALQAGVEYPITKRWEVFLDVKQLWLSVNADGMLGGTAPVTARVTLNPTLISVGFKLHL
jgi:outer membrane protein